MTFGEEKRIPYENTKRNISLDTILGMIQTLESVT